MEEYLEKLLSQIRCKKARPYIETEFRGHLEDQIAENKASGMSHAAAEKCAVLDMGDPVDVGVAMDRIHRPAIAWGTIAVVAIISLLGLLIEARIINTYRETMAASIGNAMVDELIKSAMVVVLSGLVLMFLVCMLDFTRIAKHAKWIGLFFIACMVMAAMGVFGGDINGSHYRIGFGRFQFTANNFILLYPPIYGAILYSFRREGWAAVVKAIGWLIPPVAVTFLIDNVASLVLLVCLLSVLTFALFKNWYQVQVRLATGCAWGGLFLLPLILLCVWKKRIPYFSGLGSAYNGIGLRVVSDYMIQELKLHDGMAWVLLTIVGVVLLIAVLGFILLKQKNELGLAMGVGCMTVLLLSFGANLCSNSAFFGRVIMSGGFLPLVSLGRDSHSITYILIGIVLSVSRNKNVYPKHVELKKKNNSLQV